MPKAGLKNEIYNRIKRLQDRLEAKDLDGAIIVQKVDLFYFSGTDQNAHLWVPTNGSPMLMVRKSMERANEDASIDNIVQLRGTSHLVELIREVAKAPLSRIGLEMDVLPARLYLNFQRFFPGVELVDISDEIRDIRMIKSEYEISCIRKAAELADEMFGHVPSFLESVKTENELALKIEAFYCSRGYAGISRVRTFNMENRFGHVMSGKNAAIPSSAPGPTGGKGLGPFFSQGPGNNKIGPHEPILIDYSSNVNGYTADQTRIFSIGNLEDKYHTAHQVMLEVQDVLLKRGQPGVRAEDLCVIAWKIVEKAGLKEGFMGHPVSVPFVGHGVGLELDEWPVIAFNSEITLKERMVMALEPKFVFHGEGVVGIENTFVVTAHGMEKLNMFPDTILSC